MTSRGAPRLVHPHRRHVHADVLQATFTATKDDLELPPGAAELTLWFAVETDDGLLWDSDVTLLTAGPGPKRYVC